MIFKLKKEFIDDFRKPFGKLVKNKKELKKELEKLKWKKLVCVGDFSSLAAREAGFMPDISIIDGKIERKKIEKKLTDKIQAPIILKAKNPAGTITKDSWEAVKLSFCYNPPVKIIIQGEEDLLLLPACFFAPQGSVIIYGLWNKGGVIIKTGKSIKRKVNSYLKIKKLKEIIAAGTFDRIHAGHKFFLLTAAEKSDKLLIGITSEKYLKKWKAAEKNILPFKKRLKNLKKFLSEFDFNCELFKINDPIGPAIKRGEGIIVSKNTKKGAEEINKKRERKGIKKLKIIKIKMTKDKNGKEISSSKIRKRKMDENGRIKLAEK